MKTVLAAVDFSPVTDRVIAAAIRLARAHRYRLQLLHVVVPPHAVDEFDRKVDVPRAVAAAERMAGQNFALLRKTLPGKFNRSDAVCLKGEAVAQILAHQRTSEVEYLVLGSHGRSAAYHLLVGGTANGLLKSSRCPVLIVPVDLAAAERTAKNSAGHTG